MKRRLPRLRRTLAPTTSDAPSFDSMWVADGATCELSGRNASVTTPGSPWEHAIAIAIPRGDPGIPERVLVVPVSCERGAVGLILLTTRGHHASREAVVAEGTNDTVVFLLDHPSEPLSLLVRNVAPNGASSFLMQVPVVLAVPVIDLTPADLSEALRDLTASHVGCATRAWPSTPSVAVAPTDLPFRVESTLAPMLVPTPDELWSSARDRTVLESARDLIEALPAFDAAALGLHGEGHSRAFLEAYLMMNIVRVTRLLDLLARRGFERGSVLEWGSWFGSFALALQRLGYDVTAADRYASWGTAFDAHTELLAGDGVRVLPFARGAETAGLDELGHFDVVFAGAVIEHVPHTPRLLLEALRSRVRPGGLLVVDTPNLTRYWNRRLMEEGESIFQPIGDQFDCEPPWEGHHREYTAKEIVWMLEQVGCCDVEAEFVDYNLLQFHELPDAHLSCLATLLADPSQADTVLVSGKAPLDPRTSRHAQ